MPLPTSRFPQANILGHVVSTVEAVAGGARTDAEIAAVIGKVDRQGRYYRKSARDIGLVRYKKNRTYLTELGQRFVNSSEVKRRTMLAEIVLADPVVHTIYEIVRLSGKAGATVPSLVATILQLYGGAPTTAKRRLSSILAWLKQLEMVTRVGHIVRST